MRGAAGEQPTSETARKEAATQQREDSKDDTLLDLRTTPLLTNILLSELELTACEKAPKRPKRQTISTSVPDFQSFLPSR
jgi:hypothetical protein